MFRAFSDYGMVLVLLLLAVVFSAITYGEQHPDDEGAGKRLAAEIVRQHGAGTRVLIAVQNLEMTAGFAERLQQDLIRAGVEVVEVVKGEPRDARQALQRIAQSGGRLDVIAGTQVTASWLVFTDLANDFPPLAGSRIVMPEKYWWPTFLMPRNLLNISNQIAIIAILAIGMTAVIITGGIDLSVGSLIALSAVLATLFIRNWGGGKEASSLTMILCCAGGMAVCGMVGTFSGSMVTFFNVPPFIVTLAMMLVASGLAFKLTNGESVYQIPESFVWLGRGADWLHLPNAVVLMLFLYAAAHVMMTRTVLGRYLYAVGGNREAARLAGVPVGRVLLFAYTLCGLLAGLGGVVMASQLKSGSPKYGEAYEMSVIAAVVVGGASLSGGEGRIFGTLIGAFIIAVMQNGMNLTNVDPYTQKIVLGLVILGAVLLDQLRQKAWGRTG